jgi:hypothetical protein
MKAAAMAALNEQTKLRVKEGNLGSFFEKFETELFFPLLQKSCHGSPFPYISPRPPTQMATTKTRLKSFSQFHNHASQPVQRGGAAARWYNKTT